MNPLGITKAQEHILRRLWEVRSGRLYPNDEESVAKLRLPKGPVVAGRWFKVRSERVPENYVELRQRRWIAIYQRKQFGKTETWTALTEEGAMISRIIFSVDFVIKI